MKSINLALVLGNATRDAELKATQTGVKVATFSIATNRVWKDKNTGEKKEEVEFHNCVAWGSLAEIAGKYIRKGKPLAVRGYLKTRSWEDKDGGKKNYRTEIVCDDIVLLGSREDGGSSAPPPDDSAVPAGGIPEVKYESEIRPEDLPF